MHTSCLLSLEVVEGEEEGLQGAMGAGHQGEAVPWREFPWVEGAGHRRLQAAGAAARGAGCQCQGWMWWWCSVAMAMVYWLPYCWLEEEVEPAVAMVAGVQKEEEGVGYWGEEGEVASCPLEEAVVPWDVHEVLVPGPWEEEGAASRGEACHWGLGAWGGLPCLALVEGSCVVLHDLQVLHACHESSCSQLAQSSSRGGGSAVVADCRWVLRPGELLPGCWCVLPQMWGQEPPPARP